MEALRIETRSTQLNRLKYAYLSNRARTVLRHCTHVYMKIVARPRTHATLELLALIIRYKKCNTFDTSTNKCNIILWIYMFGSSLSDGNNYLHVNESVNVRICKQIAVTKQQIDDSFC